MLNLKQLEPPFKADYVDWKRNPVTKFFMQEIFNKREYLKEGIAEDKASSDKEMWIAIGRTQGIKEIIDYIIEDFETVQDPEEEKTK